MKRTTLLAIITLATLIGCDNESSTAKQPAKEAAKAPPPMTPSPPATTAPPAATVPPTTPSPVPAPPK